MKSFSEMTDAELLAATESMTVLEDIREVECRDCGEVFEVGSQRWNVKRCPECQEKYNREAYRGGTWKERKAFMDYARLREGDGLRRGLIRKQGLSPRQG